MKRIIGLMSQLFVYTCVATMIAITVGVAMLYAKGAFGDDRLLHMWAALHGIPVATATTEVAKEKSPDEQPSFEEILNRRAIASLDLQLRESTLEKSLGELRNIEATVRTEQQRFDQLVQSFQVEIKRLETDATDAAVLETQRTLEALPPKQAKQQLLNLLNEPPSPGIENPKAAVVSLVKAMPIDRRKKILAEFKTIDEEGKLGEILKDILRGAPDVPLLREAREQLNNLNAQSP